MTDSKQAALLFSNLGRKKFMLILLIEESTEQEKMDAPGPDRSGG